MPSSQFLGQPGQPVPDEYPFKPATRSIKIESEGDTWKGISKPKIRLMGRWLERAGFKPGNRVQVRCIELGVIELRASDILAALAKQGVGENAPPLPRQDPQPPARAALPIQSTCEVRMAIALPHDDLGVDARSNRLPDRFAYCGPHFYNSSPHTRELGNFWQHCAHCGRELHYYSTCEEASIKATDCPAQTKSSQFGGADSPTPGLTQ
jgi:hypothetical protein